MSLGLPEKEGKSMIRSANRAKLARTRRLMMRHWEAYLLFVPVAAWYIIFCYVPMGGMVIAFKQFSVLKGIQNSPWIGLNIFRQLFMLPSFAVSIRNTLIMSAQKILFAFPLPIVFAVLLNEMKHLGGKRFVQTVSYLPHFISWSVAGGMVYMLLSPNTGAINALIVAMGGTPQNYIGIPAYFRTIVLLSHVWKSLGWSAIVYIAAISAVDEELYEAAYIDGAGRLQRILHITVPGILGTVSVMLILAVGNILSISFDQIFILANPMVLDVGETIDYFVYRVGLSSANNFSQATAAGMIKSVVGFVLVLSTNLITRKLTDGEGGIW